uniref:Uncharacterized protein n=1 Tax=Myoviridae sp. ctMne5 TaxID=2825089 RepID=A0A8S5TZU0_9CAUD|nr:MAG TPA: hypothetical protein [Myoviridae sp. ctMne5]
MNDCWAVAEELWDCIPKLFLHYFGGYLWIKILFSTQQ